MIETPIRTADYHTAGEPFRIVTSGVPIPEGATMLERRSWAQSHLDDVRAFLINEPRGHADMYGCFVTPPDDDRGDIGVVFFHKDGFSTACGHGTIALVTWALDSGRIPTGHGGETTVVVDVPSGRLTAIASHGDDRRVERVRFWNVASFVTGTGLTVATSQGDIEADVSYGGAFYASVALDASVLSPASGHLGALIGLAREVKAEIEASHGGAVSHTDPRLSGLYGVIFHETLAAAPLRQRNVTVFADGEVDRSPCGSGTSARLALLSHHGRLGVGEALLNEGVAGGVFVGRIEGREGTDVLTSVEGQAYAVADSAFTLDERDPLGIGFQLR